MAWNRKTAAVLALVSAAAAGTSAAITMNSFQTALIPLEGGSAGFAAKNNGTRALGAFQITPIAFQDMGLQNADGSWTAKANAMGIRSEQDFLSNPDLQVQIDNTYNSLNIGYLGSTYTSRLGTTDRSSGATLTQGNMAYCAEALGAGGCQTYLSTGKIPAWELNGNPAWANGGFEKNMTALASTSLGDSADVAVATTTTQGADGSTTQTTQVAGIFCDPAVLARLTQMGTQLSNSWGSLATRPEVGYSMLDGSSVFAAAGLPSPAGALLGPSTFSGASCLDRLRNSSLNGVFSLPSADDILNKVMQAACNAATQLATQAVAQISSSVFSAFSLNGIVPGLDLGPLGISGGVQLSPGGRANGGGLVNISNGRGSGISYSPDNGWYPSTSAYRSGCAWGSLMAASATACGYASNDGTSATRLADLDGIRGLLGSAVGGGKPEALVAAADPAMSAPASWVPGGAVRGNDITPGTPIATFLADGSYSGGHAAIYIGQDRGGIRVLDQWPGQVAQLRLIPWDGAGTGVEANTGSAYRVVKVAS